MEEVENITASNMTVIVIQMTVDELKRFIQAEVSLFMSKKFL